MKFEIGDLVKTKQGIVGKIWKILEPDSPQLSRFKNITEPILFINNIELGGSIFQLESNCEKLKK